MFILNEATASSNFRDKINVSVEAGVRLSYLIYILIFINNYFLILHYFTFYYYTFVNKKLKFYIH